MRHDIKSNIKVRVFVAATQLEGFDIATPLISTTQFPTWYAVALTARVSVIELPRVIGVLVELTGSPRQRFRVNNGFLRVE